MRILTAFLAATVLVAPAFGQEQQLVEEVVARVNADVITRSQYMQALQDAEEEIRQNVKDPALAEKEWDAFRPRVLDAMIDSMLLVQKGQEIGVDVEAQVNAQFRRLADENRMSITEFEEAMRKSGVDPSEARARLRDQMVRQEVLNREVFGAVWRNLTEKEKREYYEQNRERFMQPGELKLSELFLSVEGRTFGEIEAKAREIATQARAGTEFKELVRKHGNQQRASYANGGSLGSFASAEQLSAPLAAAVADLKTGELTEPIRVADGVIIIYVDERREAAPKPYDTVVNEVGMALVYAKSRDAETKYLTRLRNEAYIKVAEGYESALAAKTASAESNP